MPKGVYKRKSLEDRFRSKIEISGLDECWEWIASKNAQGYGFLSVGGKQVGAHRVSYQLHHGPIPEGLHVLHSCDNPSCVNPAHLHLGTNADNVRERNERDRSAREVSHGQAKLNCSDVVEIRQRYVNKSNTQTELAHTYGVARTTIQQIVNHDIWRKK